MPKPDALKGIEVPCEAVEANGKVMYIDASRITASHGDIRNPMVGELVWKLTDCLTD